MVVSKTEALALIHTDEVGKPISQSRNGWKACWEGSISFSKIRKPNWPKRPSFQRVK